MKFATAVGHLVEMADVAGVNLRLRDSGIGWPLEELWVAGELLEGPERLEAGSVVLVLEVPPDELTWLAKHPAGEWVGSQLRLGKRPFLWAYRPFVWPVWNHRHRRVARFWSAEHGPDTYMLESLAERKLNRLPVVEPTVEDLVQQLSEELTASRRHLRGVLDHYWDYDWRRDHRGRDETPEDHLWRAAQAVSEMQDALTDSGNEHGSDQVAVEVAKLAGAAAGEGGPDSGGELAGDGAVGLDVVVGPLDHEPVAEARATGGDPAPADALRPWSEMPSDQGLYRGRWGFRTLDLCRVKAARAPGRISEIGRRRALKGPQIAGQRPHPPVRRAPFLT